MKNEVKTSYFRDHIRTWTVISKKKRKKVFTFFSNQRAPRGFNSFSKSGFRVKSLPTPVLGTFPLSCFAVEIHAIRQHLFCEIPEWPKRRSCMRFLYFPIGSEVYRLWRNFGICNFFLIESDSHAWFRFSMKDFTIQYVLQWKHLGKFRYRPIIIPHFHSFFFGYFLLVLNAARNFTRL